MKLAMESDQLKWLGRRLDLVKMLLDAGIPVDEPRGQLLWQAVANRDPELCEFLIGEGADVDLRFAAGLNRIDRMEDFLDARGKLVTDDLRGFFRPRTVDEAAWTNQNYLDEALSYASAAGAMEAAEFLLTKGADVNSLASVVHWDHGSTALHKAASNQHLEMVHLLLRSGASPLIKDLRWDEPPSDWSWRNEDIRQVLKVSERNARLAED